MVITPEQLTRIGVLALGLTTQVTIRKPTTLDALPDGYVVATVRYGDTAIEYGIAPDGRASS